MRELRQRASELLRRVEAGETFEVTDRGRPVAHLSPVKDRSALERMREIGDLQPRAGDLADLPEPLTLPRGSEPPSRTLARLRADER